MTALEPEREMVRRALPYAVPALALGLALGTILGGWGAGWSAAIGVAIVALNLVAHGLSLAWAARISPTMVLAVGLGGFALRLGTILVVLILLNRLPWFSAAAFVAAVVPATILLLVYEAKLLSGRMQVDLWASARDTQR
jgi:ATP synthase protein I